MDYLQRLYINNVLVAFCCNVPYYNSGLTVPTLQLLEASIHRKAVVSNNRQYFMYGFFETIK